MTRPEAREAKRRAADTIMRAGLATIFQEWLDLNDLVVCHPHEEKDSQGFYWVRYTEINLREMYPEVNS